MSLDGGKVGLRTAKGKALIWRDYLVNSQVLAKPLICLGDGHDGIWNLFREIGEKQERIEILDWYHLIENLYKVGGSFQRIEEVKCFLKEGGSGRGYLLCAKDGQSRKWRILLLI